MRTTRAFTLIEVVVALAILSMISAMVYAAFDGAVKLREAAQIDEETVDGGRVAIARMSREVRMAFLDPRLYSATAGQLQGGTLTETYKTLFKGEDDGGNSKLTFTSFSHVRLYHGSNEGDQTELAWWLEPDEGSNGLYKLMHRESPRIDEDPEKGGIDEVLAYGVREFRLRYYDFRKEEWQTEWDSDGTDYKGRLPKAVEINLILEDPDEIAHPYHTKVYLDLFKALPPNLGGVAASRSTGTAGGGGPRNPLAQGASGLFGQPGAEPGIQAPTSAGGDR